MDFQGKDRKDIFLPASHVKVLEHLRRVNKNIVVVLLNGSPIDTSWDRNAKAILEMFLAGQSLGSAVANILYGNATPGGKLPVSFPCALEQTPAYLNYPGCNGKVEYKEGIFVGYRYYLTKKISVKYPFGFGLSYTVFDIKLVNKEINGNNISFDLEIANIGAFDGSEVVQVYVESPKGSVPRAVRELKAFKRVYLEKREKKLISFALNEKDFAYYDEKMHSWYAPKGTYNVVVSTDCTNTKLAMAIDITPQKGQHSEITGWSTVGALRESEAGRVAIERIKQLLRDSDNEQALKFPLLQRNGESDDQVDKIPLRMITVLTDNTINNDIMDDLIETVNNQNLEKYR